MSSALLLASAIVSAIGIAPAAATTLPGAPGTPVAVGVNGVASLRWSAPADIGSPPLTRYKVEANDGSGWVTAGAEHGIKSVAAGGAHSCSLLDDGSVKCWGKNSAGQLGSGDTANRGDGPGEMGDALPAVSLGTGRSAIAIAAGSEHTCALLDDGSVKCWGYGFYGQIGQGDTANRGDGPGEMGDALPAVSLGAGSAAVAIAAGSLHTCALLDDGAVKCWGRNASGQLGVGDVVDRGDGPGEMGDTLPAVSLGIGRTAIAIAAGSLHTCALLDDSTTKCWGDNAAGQLGLGDTAYRGDEPGEMGDALAEVPLGSGRTADAISVGDLHSCALLDDGSVKCWGGNAAGQLGLGDTAYRGDEPGEMGDSLAVVALGTGRTAADIAAGGYRTCAQLDDGSVKCWGKNNAGQLGLGNTSNRGDGPGEMGDSLLAVQLGTGRTAVSTVAGTDHSCVFKDDAELECWGLNGSGQLGQGDPTSRGDGPGEMGDSLPPVSLGTGRALAPARAAVVRLVPGAYQLRVVAQSSAGESAPSVASPSVTVSDSPLGVPGAPAGVAGTSGNGTVDLTWSAPSRDGGDAITDYEVSVFDVSGGAPWGVVGATTRLVGSAATVYAFTGLTNGTEYAFKVSAVNSVGGGPLSDLSAGVIPARLPGPPTGVAGTSGDGEVDLVWSAPADDGDAWISDYEVSVYAASGAPASGVGGQTTRLVGSEATGYAFTGLANGTEYAFRVAAVNPAGTGAQSVLSGGVTPLALPGVPTGVAGTSSDGQVDLTWTAPAESGGVPLTDYSVSVYSASGGPPEGVAGPAARLVGSATTSYSFAGLTNGVAYAFKVAAITSVGTGGTSGLSSPVTPATSPGAPTGVAGTSGDSAVDLTWTVPADDGGAAITDYKVVVYDAVGGDPSGVTGMTTREVGSASTHYEFTGLTNGTGYTFRVAAMSSAGESPPSDLSAELTPLAVPGAPAGVVGTAGAGRVALVWAAPTDDGGAAITDYRVSAYSSSGGAPSGVTGTTARLVGSATTLYEFAGLTNGTSYRFGVAAVSAVGTGASSALSVAVTPATVPGKPTDVKTVSGSTTSSSGPLLVSFRSGASNGSAITGYTASCTSSNGGIARSSTGTGSPLTVTRATTGKRYTCKVRATNGRGGGSWSSASAAVIMGSPAAPTRVTATRVAAGSLRVSFRPGASNGRAITGYTASCTSSNGGVARSKTGTRTPLTVTRLTAGKRYTCTVRGTNSRGAGLASAPSAAVRA